ncbi:hypothetical protein Atai01_68450 [Amycolatopsis taiwanensis]|uniref:Aldehyde dehydrogenase domain-containing protein n=1 Tax=Amycolatopsis taiwanensis TaxID=342230 RepID=A0A9W6R6A2_9PSEU|nr:hypothetical protein Atai01_68450 [Amycolatopsis taiwanensis]
MLAEAGLPEGLLHVLPGGADVGEALVAHPGVPCISFTGSTAAGRVIGAAAAPLLKKVHLELGGNNALLVLPDADLDDAASAGAFGSFLHQGQICMTTGRHLVPADKAEEYVAKLAEKATAIKVGDPEDPANALGPVIDARQRDRIHDLVVRTVERGAALAVGGSYEGLFGAIELAERIESGAVHINDQTVDDEAVAPFGGVKASGTGGRFGGSASLDTFSEVQWVTAQTSIERYPF